MQSTPITGYWREHSYSYWLLETVQSTPIITGLCRAVLSLLVGDCAESCCCCWLLETVQSTTVMTGDWRDCAEQYYYYWLLETVQSTTFITGY